MRFITSPCFTRSFCHFFVDFHTGDGLSMLTSAYFDSALIYSLQVHLHEGEGMPEQREDAIVAAGTT
jgi:hypothetical protein